MHCRYENLTLFLEKTNLKLKKLVGGSEVCRSFDINVSKDISMDGKCPEVCVATSALLDV